jgi:hypothetical protein
MKQPSHPIQHYYSPLNTPASLAPPGTYVKKEQYLKQAFNPILKQAVTATRTRTAARSFELLTSEAKAFLLTRFWPGDGPGPGVST